MRGFLMSYEHSNLFVSPGIRRHFRDVSDGNEQPVEPTAGPMDVDRVESEG